MFCKPKLFRAFLLTLNDGLLSEAAWLASSEAGVADSSETGWA